MIQLKSFISFCRSLFSKWSLWVFGILDLAGLVAILAIPNLSIPRFVFAVVSMIGLFWASFRVYLEQQRLIPSGETARQKTSRLSIRLLEGDQYEYHLDEPSQEAIDQYRNGPTKDGEKLVLLPNSTITIKIRASNDGELPLDILNAKANIDMTIPLHFMIPDPAKVDGTYMKFPVRLEPGEVVEFILLDSIFPWSNFSAAQIAAGIHTVLQKHVDPSVKVFVDAIDSNGRSFTAGLETSISVRPLCEKYMAYWRKAKETELVRLATK